MPTELAKSTSEPLRTYLVNGRPMRVYRDPVFAAEVPEISSIKAMPAKGDLPGDMRRWEVLRKSPGYLKFKATQELATLSTNGGGI